MPVDELTDRARVAKETARNSAADDIRMFNNIMIIFGPRPKRLVPIPDMKFLEPDN